MKKFFVKSLGCKTNQIEGQIIAENLKEHGFEQVKNSKVANFFILNSCTVTSSADSEVKYLLNKAKRDNPNATTVLVGCIVSAQKELVKEWADVLLDNSEKLKISDYLEEKIAEHAEKNTENIFENVFLKNPTSSRVSIKIQEGCNNSCAYCIIPRARGKSRSNRTENIIEEINHLVSLGKEEVILTGIHIGLWGLEWGKKLEDLLIEIEKTDIKRYRLGSLYVNELDDNLLEFLAKSEKFCPHFHLSLQSMCNKTLQNMKRKYTVQEELDKISKLHKLFPNAFLGADIIVGFPMETSVDFEETIENIKKARLSKLHVFPYSKRKGTVAAVMEGQVPESEKKVRARKLIKVSDELLNEFLERNIGLELNFIFDDKINKFGMQKGVSENYIEIFSKENYAPSKIHKIRLEREMLGN
ncbi:tRNA (N(6)-L-threonylcarbamoyladenosine(37)-C(2))-methylthiotransferase MtaB [bacterium]|nr:tRNA (N(6)-L-threonylcarbamoyladenosine(37)-C(2))-methylthiotransferase MtaB [bacterium]